MGFKVNKNFTVLTFRTCIFKDLQSSNCTNNQLSKVVLHSHAKITIASSFTIYLFIHPFLYLFTSIYLCTYELINLFIVYANPYIMCLKCKDTFKINLLVFVLFIR
jgi:hypothetical protein